MRIRFKQPTCITRPSPAVARAAAALPAAEADLVQAEADLVQAAEALAAAQALRDGLADRVRQLRAPRQTETIGVSADQVIDWPDDTDARRLIAAGYAEPA